MTPTRTEVAVVQLTPTMQCMYQSFKVSKASPSSRDSERHALRICLWYINYFIRGHSGHMTKNKQDIDGFDMFR